jgi:hypothetical protein
VGSGSDYAAAHYNTPSSYRSAANPWIEVSFIDNGPGTQRAQLWGEKEGSPGAAWFQFGSWNETSYPTWEKYGIYLWDVDGDLDYWTWLGDRSLGEHSLRVGKNTDGSVDFWFDNSLVLNTTQIHPAYFGDIYLASRYGESTFTGYSVGSGYEAPAPVPEPTSIALLCVASAGVLCAIKRKKKA